MLALLTFALVCLAWIFFRADSFERAFALTAASFGFGPAQLRLPLLDLAIIGLTVGGLMVLHGLLRNSTLEQAAARLHWSVLSLLLAGMLTAIALTPSEDRAFIYFQF